MRKRIFAGLIVLGALVTALALWGWVTGIREFASMTPAPTADEFMAKGMQEYNAHDLKSAEDDFLHAFQLDPQNPIPLVRRGIVLADMGDHEEAITSFTGALALGKSNPGADAVVYVSRADSLAKLGKIEDALADYDRAVALDAGLSAAYVGRVRTRLFLGKFAEALADCERMFKDNPNNGLALYGLGVIAYAQRDWAKAAAHFDALVRAAPKDADSAMWAILARKRSGQPVDAAAFQEVDRTQWPGQVVAHLSGQVGPLDKFIDDAGTRKDPREVQYICKGTFATFALIQIENRVEGVARDYEKIKPGKPYLDDMLATFTRCIDISVEGWIGQSEINFLKAR